VEKLNSVFEPVLENTISAGKTAKASEKTEPVKAANLGFGGARAANVVAPVKTQCQTGGFGDPNAGSGERAIRNKAQQTSDSPRFAGTAGLGTPGIRAMAQPAGDKDYPGQRGAEATGLGNG